MLQWSLISFQSTLLLLLTIATFAEYLLCFQIVLLHLLVLQYIPDTKSQRNTCNNEQWLLGKIQNQFRFFAIQQYICSQYVFWQLNMQQLFISSFFTVLFIGENLTENLQYQDIESPVVCHPNKQPKVVQELGQTASLRCRVSILCIVVGYSFCFVSYLYLRSSLKSVENRWRL